MLLMGVASAFAQIDTTSTQVPQTDQQSDQGKNYRKDMVKIQSSELPDQLRTTLKGSQYKGWENGTIYRNKNNDGFLIETKENGKTRTFRFDGSGKPIED
jgi:hypothetical protein